ncbi:MAG: transglutaminase domain-containing protein [Solirubrobacterales bacterium]
MSPVPVSSEASAGAEPGEAGRPVHGLPVARLAAFAGLATLAAFHWASLVVEPPGVGLAVVVASSVLAALAMAEIERRLPPGRPRAAAALAIAAASVACGLVAVGLEPVLLLPSGWERLGSELEAGFSSLSGDLDYPFAAAGGLATTLLLAGLPLLLALALIPAFWPDRGPGPRYDALALMIAAYAVPATVNPRGGQGWVGLVLLLLIATWLFAPRLRRPLAIGAVALAGLACVPLAGALEGDPWLDYRDWELGGSHTSFEWEHSYGPIDWPRTGETLFTVESEEAEYWRAEVLEGFDGRGWIRSGGAGARVALGLGPAGIAGDPPSRWIQRARFSFEGLEGSQVIAPGTALEVDGISPSAMRRGDDGSIEVVGEPLDGGSNYGVSAYAPDPSAARTRAASERYDSVLSQYTGLSVPVAPGPSGAAAGGRVEIPVWGSEASRELADGQLSASPYSRMAALARRLVSDAPTAYDATLAVETHLRGNYTYSERPRDRPLPLDAFLFEDRIGYCQQFSGAMAAMLRMVGVPSRVATGFTPGRKDSERGVFEVSDLDAHSWVEVYFNDVGWVPFDPTPSAAPARSQEEGLAQRDAAALGGDAPEAPQSIRDAGTAADIPGAEAADSRSGFPLAVVALLGALALVAPFAVGLARLRRYRRLDRDQRLERGIAEVDRIAGLARIETRRSTTLWRLSDRLRRRRLRAGASYVAALAAGRYGSSGSAPTLADRRRVRAELATGGGLVRRLRLWWELPPGGPRAARAAGRAPEPARF